MTTHPSGIDLDQVGVRNILNALADGAYITDLNRKILFWSRAAETITGWPAREVVGRTCFDNILVHEDKDGHALCGQEHCPLHRSIVTGQISQEPLLVFARHKQGHRVPVEVSVAPIRDTEDRIVGGIEVFRDLTLIMDDLRRARIIQDHALDSKLTADPRLRIEVAYTPEEIVGGDFYRVEAVDPDHYALMIADVMGHGVAAALFTMQLRSLWEECRVQLRDPAGFLASLSSRLHRLASADGYFATAVQVLLNAATGEIQYARAGHPTPLLFRSQGPVEPLDHRGAALGLVETSAYTAAALRLEPGDALLFFTDGAVEITDAQGVELGLSGLQRLLEDLDFPRGASDLAAVERRLLEYSHRIRLPDDLTLIRVQRTESSGGNPSR